MYPAALDLTPARRGPRAPVGRAVVNATFDQRVHRICARYNAEAALHNGESGGGVKVADPLFIATALHRCDRIDSDLPVFADARALLRYWNKKPTPVPSNWEQCMKTLFGTIGNSYNVRFLGFSETELALSEIGKRDPGITVNAGGSVSVLCGDTRGLRIGERVCLALPDDLNDPKWDGTLALRSYDRLVCKKRAVLQDCNIAPIGRVIQDPCTKPGQRTYILFDWHHTSDPMPKVPESHDVSEKRTEEETVPVYKFSDAPDDNVSNKGTEKRTEDDNSSELELPICGQAQRKNIGEQREENNDNVGPGLMAPL